MQKIILLLMTWGISLPFLGQAVDSSIISVNGRSIGWEKTWYFTLGNKRIPLEIIEYGNSPGIVLLSIHDDEITSINAAKTVLENTGGVLLKIGNKNERLISFILHGKKYRFDPNRMFSRAGIRKNLLQLNKYYRESAVLAIEKFSRFVLGKIPKNAPTLVAVHNNSNRGYSVDSYGRGGEYEKDVEDRIIHDSGDKDNFFLTTDKEVFKSLKESGYNLVLQDNKKARDDGSLSIFYGREKKSYVNVEAESGQVDEQVKMIKAIVDAIDNQD